MLTRCPHCQAHFRVTADLIKRAAGDVCCGRCQQHFNAVDNMVDLPLPPMDNLPAEADPAQIKLFEDTEATGTNPESGHREMTGKEEKPLWSESDEDEFPQELLDQVYTEEVADDDELLESEAAIYLTDEVSPEAVAEEMRETESATATEDAAETDVPQLDTSEAGEALDAETEKDGAEGQELTILSASSHTTDASQTDISDTPDERHGEQSLVSQRRQTVMASVSIVVLIILLIAQAAYFWRDRLGQYPHVRPYIVQMCGFLGSYLPCDLSLPRDVKRITLLDREVRSHPEHRDALQITATIVNKAEFSQPYPLVRLTLSNRHGAIVASRDFYPADYLDSSYNVRAGMPPDQPITLNLAVSDPGKDAVGFVFEFF